MCSVSCTTASCCPSLTYSSAAVVVLVILVALYTVVSFPPASAIVLSILDVFYLVDPSVLAVLFASDLSVLAVLFRVGPVVLSRAFWYSFISSLCNIHGLQQFR